MSPGSGTSSPSRNTTWNDRFASPIQYPSITVDAGADGSAPAPSVTNSGRKWSAVGCAYGMPGARRKFARVSTSPRASASAAQTSNSEDHPGTSFRVIMAGVTNGSPWVRNPDPMTSTPVSRSGRSRSPSDSSASGSDVGMDSCSTGTSASGYMTLSGTQAPWSRPRLGCWCAGALSGISDATSRANPAASGVR